MTDQLKRWVRPDLLGSPLYRVPLPEIDIKLNQNESPWDWPARIKADIVRELKTFEWNRYPHVTTQALREKLAASLDVQPGQIVLANGSNEILQALSILTLEPGAHEEKVRLGVAG